MVKLIGIRRPPKNSNSKLGNGAVLLSTFTPHAEGSCSRQATDRGRIFDLNESFKEEGGFYQEAMDFSEPLAVSRSQVISVPGTRLIAVVNGKTLAVRLLDTLELVEGYTLPAVPLHLSCTKQPPHVIAVASSDSLSLLYLQGETADEHENVFVSISLSHMPLMSVVLTEEVGIAFHPHGLGASIFPLRGLRGGPLAPVFLRHVASPRTLLPPSSLPPTAALSPCEKYFASALKLPNGSPAVHVVALPGANLVAAAAGTVALGGRITELAGLLWLTRPHCALFVWGQPVDGVDAICLLGPDCALLEEGMPSSSLADESSAPTPTASRTPGVEATKTPPSSRRTQRRRRRSSTLSTASQNLAASAVEVDDRQQDLYRDLGVKSATKLRGGPVIALGGYDGTIRLLNTTSWTLIASWNLDHPTVDADNQPAVFLQREKLTPAEDSENCRAGVARTSYFEVAEGIGRFALPPRKQFRHETECSDELQCTGVGLLRVSACGCWLAGRSDRQPCVVFVVDLRRARLASALVMSSDVRSLSWTTTADADAQLAVALDGQAFAIWREEGAAVVRVPDLQPKARRVTRALGIHKPFRPRRISWNTGDDTLFALDAGVGGSFSVVYMR